MGRRQNILISGANGYLAKSIRKLLTQRDCTFTSLVRHTFNLIPEKKENPILCDLLDLNLLKKKLAGYNFDIIIHCASLQPSNTTDLDDYMSGNVVTLKNLLNAVNFTQTMKFIHFSSAVVYGNIRFQKIHENTPTYPTNNYALSKLISEHVLRIHALQYSFPAICLRLPSLHGNQQKNGLINTYFETIIQNKPLEIYSNGELQRNIMSFDAVAQACEPILSIKIKPGFHLYQLGSKNTLSMKEIAEYIDMKTKSGAILRCINKSTPNEADWDFNVNKACCEIGFKPITIQKYLDDYVTQELKNGNANL